MTVSLAYEGARLGTTWGVQRATRMLHEAGFTDVRMFESVDPVNHLYVAR